MEFEDGSKAKPYDNDLQVCWKITPDNKKKHDIVLHFRRLDIEKFGDRLLVSKHMLPCSCMCDVAQLLIMLCRCTLTLRQILQSY